MEYKNTVKQLLKIVNDEGASDLHIAEDRQPIIRVSGLLMPLVKIPALTRADLEGIAKVIVPEKDYKEFFVKKEADFSYDDAGGARFRVNGFFQQTKMAFAFRLIPRYIRTLEELGLPRVLEEFTKKPQGFFLVVGPVGQGKTTTLAAMIDLINTERPEHILTIEDPIEYIIEPKRSMVDQREVGIDTADFNAGLTAMFRQDINVVLLGEMRGIDAISTAVTAAETGHLVFSTLHTNTASQTINRIIDSFPAGQQDQIRSQLSTSLTGIFSQRLIPRISGGLVPAYELLINNNAVGNLIRERRVHEINTVIETSSEQGMISMEHSLVELVRKGEITVENARLHSFNTKALDRML